jgi:hypothetical protein
MPAEFARAQGDFHPGLLNLVFSEKHLAERGRGVDDLGRLSFRHSQKGYGRRLASRAPTRGANPLLNGIEIVSQTHEAIVNRKS